MYSKEVSGELFRNYPSNPSNLFSQYGPCCVELVMEIEIYL
jgi:hypothetical protein